MNDKNYVEKIDTFWKHWKTKKDEFDIKLWWDVGKVRIKMLSKTFCIEKRQIEKLERKTIEKDLSDLMEQNDPQTFEKIEELKSRLKDLDMQDLKGIKIRSKIKWREEGETASRFFCNLEKKNAITKTFERVQSENGNIVTDINDIVKEQVSFYKKLYSIEQTDK